MLTGILHMPSKVTCDSYHCALTLRHADPADTGFAWATIWVMDSWAPDSNEMASLKDEYEESDIKLYTEDGRILGVGDRVTVIGWPENFPCLTIEVEIIR